MKILDRANIRVSVCGIFAKPTFKSEMVSQALIDEVVEILDKDGSWYKIRLLYDNYEGWIHEMYLKSSNTRDSNDIVNNKVSSWLNDNKDDIINIDIINKSKATNQKKYNPNHGPTPQKQRDGLGPLPEPSHPGKFQFFHLLYFLNNRESL